MKRLYEKTMQFIWKAGMEAICLGMAICMIVFIYNAYIHLKWVD